MIKIGKPLSYLETKFIEFWKTREKNFDGTIEIEEFLTKSVCEFRPNKNDYKKLFQSLRKKGVIKRVNQRKLSFL